MAREPGAVGAGSLDAHALELAKGAQPGVQVAISRGMGGEGCGAQHPAGLIHRRRYVNVAVGVHAADDATR